MLKSQNLEKICLAIIRWGSYLILLLPIFVYRQTLFPYILPKIIAFQIIIEILLFCWLLLIVCQKQYRPNFKNPLVLSLTIFIGILFLTALTGVDTSRSFFGTIERMTGVLTMLHFYAWFLILVGCFKKWQDWRKFIWVSLLASLIIGGLGLLELYKLAGLNPKLFLLDALKGGGGRMQSSLGNAIFLAAYSMLHIFLAAFLAFLEKKWFLRGAAIFLLAFNLIAMFWSASRAVILIFGLSLLLFFILLIFASSNRLTKIISLFLLIFLISSLVFLFLPQNKVLLSQAPYFLQRLVNLSEGFWTRTLTWQIAYQGFKEKPLLGWGWENFNVVFNKYYHPRYLEAGFVTTWYDRSHNQLLDLLVLTAISGILSYLAFFFFLFKLFCQKFEKEISRAIKTSFLVLILMFFAYFLQNLFIFDTPGPLIVFYFSLSLACFITADSTKLRIDYESANKNTNKNKLSSPLIFIAVLLLLFAIYNLNLKPFWQSRLAFKAATVSFTNLEAGLNFYQQAFNKQTFANSEITLQLLKSVMNAQIQGKENPVVLKQGIELAILEAEKATKTHPWDARYHLYLGKFYNLAADFDRNYLEKSEKAFRKALELSPQRQEVYYDLGLTKVLQQKPEEAIEIYKKAVSLNPEVKDSYWYLGLAYLNAEKYEEGLKEIEKVEVFPTKDSNTLLFVAQGYGRVQKYSQAIAICDLVLENNPGYIPAMASKTIYLFRMGEKTKALQLIDQISVLDKPLAQELQLLTK